MGYKRHLNVSVDEDMIDLAKKLNLNISSLIEDAILKKENLTKLKKTIYPKELTELEPEKCWIDPKDGLYKERGEEQFFINEGVGVVPVSKKEYLLRYRITAKAPYSTKPTPPNPKNVPITQHDFLDKEKIHEIGNTEKPN